MTDQNVNSTLERRREEQKQQAEQLAKSGQENLQRIATGGLKIWQDYLALGTTMADAWADNLHNLKTSLEQMANSAQNQDREQNRRAG
jgi:hypothetical protein